MEATNNTNPVCTASNTLVLTDPEDASRWLSTKEETTAYVALIVTVWIIGVTSNCAFFYMWVRVPRMHTVVNLYLGNLAVADTVYLSVNLTYGYGILKSPIKESVPFRNKFMCATMYELAYITYWVSLLIITLVTYDRFLAACRPLLRRKVNNKRRAAKLLIAAWLIAIIPATFSILVQWAKQVEFCIKWPRGSFYTTLPQKVIFCSALISNAQTTLIAKVLFATIFFLVLSINIFMYCRIIMALKPQNRAGTALATINSQTVIHNQVTRMLVITGIVFFCCQLPLRFYTIGSLVRIFGWEPLLSDRHHQIFLIIGRILLLFNSSTNSFIYGSTSEHYRKGFMEAFCRRRFLPTNVAQLSVRHDPPKPVQIPATYGNVWTGSMPEDGSSSSRRSGNGGTTSLPGASLTSGDVATSTTGDGGIASLTTEREPTSSLPKEDRKTVTPPRPTDEDGATSCLQTENVATSSIQSEDKTTPNLKTEDKITLNLSPKNGPTQNLPTEDGTTSQSLSSENGTTQSLSSEDGTTPSFQTENGATRSLPTEDGATLNLQTEDGASPNQ